MKLPKEGDFITIQSYKHDKSLHRTWRDTMVLKTTDTALIGVNDHTLVPLCRAMYGADSYHAYNFEL